MRRLCLVCILLLLFAGSAWGQTAEEADKLNARLVELYEAGEYDEAIVIGKQALSISEKVLGADHPDTATS